MTLFACRICLFTSENQLNYKLIGKVKDVIELCLPEIKNTIQDNSIICNQCFFFLKNVSEFRKKCLENQKKLHQSPKIEIENTIFRKFSENESINKRKAIVLESVNDSADGFIELLNSSSNLQKSGPYLNFQQNILTDNYINNIIITQKETNPPAAIETIIIDSDSEDEKTPEIIVNFKSSNEITIDENELKNNDFEEEKFSPCKIKQEKESQPKRASPITIKYDCQFCEKSYKTSKGLFDHCTTKHDDEDINFCSMCNFFTPDKTKIDEHYKVFHLLDVNDSFSRSVCVICSKKILLKSMTRHLMHVHNLA